VPAGLERRDRPERPVVSTGAAFTVKVETQGERSVYACSQYHVTMLPGGAGAKVTMMEHGSSNETNIDVPSGSSIFVVNAHGATIDVVRTQPSKSESRPGGA